VLIENAGGRFNSEVRGAQWVVSGQDFSACLHLGALQEGERERASLTAAFHWLSCGRWNARSLHFSAHFSASCINSQQTISTEQGNRFPSAIRFFFLPHLLQMMSEQKHTQKERELQVILLLCSRVDCRTGSHNPRKGWNRGSGWDWTHVMDTHQTSAEHSGASDPISADGSLRILSAQLSPRTLSGLFYCHRSSDALVDDGYT